MSASNRTARWLSSLSHASHLVWGIVLATALVLLAVVFVVQQAELKVRELAFTNVQYINSKMVLSDEVRLRSYFATLDKVLLVLRKDFADNPKMTYPQLLDRLAELKLDGKLTPRVFLMDAAGDVLLMSARSGNARSLQMNFADRAYFQAHQTEPGDVLLVGAPYQSRVMDNTWAIPLTRRITNNDGSFGGVIGVAVDPALFTEPFEASEMGLEMSRAVIGLDGTTRVRLIDGKLEFGGDVRRSKLFDEVKRSKVGTYTAVAAVDGIKRMMSYRLLDPYGIILLSGSSVASIEATYAAQVRGFYVAASLFSSLILLLSGLLVYGVARQKKLFESQQQFNQLIELVPQLVSRLDVHGNTIWVNSRTLEFVGPSAQDRAKGFDWIQAAIHPEDSRKVQEYLFSAMERSQNIESCEYRNRRFDGSYLWFSSQVTQVFDKEGAVASFLQTGTDIHDRKMAEERARVSSKLESIGQLTGGMAHDFNNLLAIILGNLDLLKPNMQKESDSKRLGVAIGAAQRGVGLVKSLLALASKQPLLPARVDLWGLVERIAPLLQHALGQRVQFTVLPPQSRVQVEVDEAGLEAVLLNLTVNARDAMPQGGELSLRLEVVEGMACIAVTDTGTGMPEAVLKRATEPFFTTKERGHGTGLGLSMVAGFAKQSGGTMKIQSVEGKGTTIALFLPVVTGGAAAVELPALPSPIRAAPVVKRRILIVDDEPALAELARDWVKADGHVAVLAHSAEDALVLLNVKAFDVLVTDIMMPGKMDGIGLAEKCSTLYPAMKILLMSGYSKETATHRVDVPWPLLVKPFRKEDFETAMEEELLA